MILSGAGRCNFRKCAEGSENQSLGPVWSRSHQSEAMSTVVSCFVTSCDAQCGWVQCEGKVCRAYHFAMKQQRSARYSECKIEYQENCNRVSQGPREGGMIRIGRDSESVRITFRRRQRSRRLGHMLVIGV